jgi:alkylation response protein AidB-like acyl-CoA dehydrogenase
MSPLDSSKTNARATNATSQETTHGSGIHPEEQAFREESAPGSQQPAPEISHKVHNALRLTRDDMQRWAKILGKKGWLAYGWPKQFGGPGWTPCKSTCSKKNAPGRRAAHRALRPVMVAPVIMAYGTRAAATLPARHRQRRSVVEPGLQRAGLGLGPGLGQDPRRARGRQYIVNGQKTWTTLGQYGEWIFCLVRTSNEGKPQTGISFLLIDMKSPGVTVRPIKLLDGECEVNEVFFDNVEVPAENLIGEENKGWTYAKHLLATSAPTSPT